MRPILLVLIWLIALSNLSAQIYLAKTAGVEAASELNDRQTAILVDTIRAGHLYAIGEPADGRGEIFIWDNASFVAAITTDKREPFVQRFVKNIQASYLLYADVPTWDTIVLTKTVRTLSELENVIANTANAGGIDTLKGFPFLLIGRIKSGTGNISFIDTTLQNAPPDGNYTFPLLDKRAQMIGFYLGDRSANNRVRIHFRLQNKYHAGRLTVADFDENEPIKLFLPKNKSEVKTVKVNDTDFSKGRLGHIQEIELGDLAKFHGHLCDGLAEGYLALQYGLYQLFPDSIIDRTNVRIVSKPSPCLTDVAIYLTGARYQFNTFYVSSEIDGMFLVQRIDDGQSLMIQRNPGVKPPEIDRLGMLAIDGKLTDCDLENLKKLEEAYTTYLLNTPPDQNFQIRRIPNFEWKPDLKNDFIKTDNLNKGKSKCN